VRVLVTGSRLFSDRRIIRKALDVINEQPGPHTLVHGAARGADQTAASYALRLGWKVEPHPANWQQPCTDQCRHRERLAEEGYCASAGKARNAEMVSSGADVCLAFLAGGERNAGTKDCVRRAEKALILVHQFYDKPVPRQGVLL